MCRFSAIWFKLFFLLIYLLNIVKMSTPFEHCMHLKMFFDLSSSYTHCDIFTNCFQLPNKININDYHSHCIYKFNQIHNYILFILSALFSIRPIFPLTSIFNLCFITLLSVNMGFLPMFIVFNLKMQHEVCATIYLRHLWPFNFLICNLFMI